jgi:hypothetical protein
MLATFRKSLPPLIFHFFSDSRFGGFATTLRYLQLSEKKNKLENWPPNRILAFSEHSCLDKFDVTTEVISRYQ